MKTSDQQTRIIDKLAQRNLLLTLFLICFIIFNSQGQCGCTHTINTTTYQVVDGTQLGVLPGDTICVTGNQTYAQFFWQNINGTAQDPVIIKNCGGQVIIDGPNSNFGWKVHSSEHFKILGDGDPAVQYGFKVTTENSFFMTMEYFTTNFEIAHVEIVGRPDTSSHLYTGFAGIGIKTSPYQDCQLFQNPGAWTMEDVSIHDNYIHQVGGEGIYAGHGFHQGRQEPSCPSGMVTYPHAIHNLHIYNNRIENVGFDGIQVKNSTQNALVHDNVIYNYGERNEGAHNEGLFIGESTEGTFYNNRVEKGTGHGMQINAYGNSVFYNNVVIDAADNGVYLNNQSASFENKNGTFEFLHNTFVGIGEYAFESYTPQDIDFKNNIFADYQLGKYRGGGPTTVAGDIYSNNVSAIGFVDPNQGDYSLTATSIAVDSGVTTPSVSFDILNNPRNDGKKDVGAYEYSPVSSLFSISASDAIQVKIYPNPATNHIQVVQEKGKLESYELQTIMGQTIQQGKLNTFTTINLGELPQGVYFLNIHLEEGNVVKQIVKR